MTSAVHRELIINCVFNTSRDFVFKTWTNPEHLHHWWCQIGFTITTQEIDVRQDGVWRYTMHGSDGVNYDNKIVYLEGNEPERLVYSHGDNAGEHFRVTATFNEKGNTTELTMHMLFVSVEELNKAVQEYGAIEGAKSTFDRLEEH